MAFVFCFNYVVLARGDEKQVKVKQKQLRKSRKAIKSHHKNILYRKAKGKSQVASGDG